MSKEDTGNPNHGLSSFEAKKLGDQMGITVKVDRETKSGILQARANEMLRDIGCRIKDHFFRKETDKQPYFRNFKYLGSCAAHIYVNETLGQIEFITQTDTMQHVPEWSADHATMQLRKDLMAHYGRKRKTWRSGL